MIELHGLDEERGLCDEARRFIRAVAEKLESAEIGEQCDEGALRMLCVSYDIYVKASKKLLRDGPMIRDKHGRESVNPAVSLVRTYYGQVLAFMREFGMTPRARERMRGFTPEVDDDNILKMFINGEEEDERVD